MERRFKIIFLLAVLFMTSLPVMGILRGTNPPPSVPEEKEAVTIKEGSQEIDLVDFQEQPILQEMAKIPAGEFIQGTNAGGYNEGPESVVYVDQFWIDKYEVTNHQYTEFVEATGHRKPGPPSRYARKLGQLRGVNQPVTYVSWHDAAAFCQWKNKRLPTEKEWEKAMRGTDGWIWPWGMELDEHAANFGGNTDGFEYTAPVGSFPRDRSTFNVFDGAGNLMEWADDWYMEDLYRVSNVSETDGLGPRTYKTLRGRGYASRGADLRITNRIFMVPDFRDETIGFRCAKSDDGTNNGDVLAQSDSGDSQRKSK